MILEKKLKKQKQTDSVPIPEKTSDLKNRPEALNLLNIYSFLINQFRKYFKINEW